jgi:hypothetical protein
MKPHRIDAVSLTFALMFLVVAGWWLVAQAVDLGLPAVGWFVAGGLILFGLLGLLGALRSARTDPARPTSAAPTSGSPVSVPPVVSTPPVTSSTPAGGLWTEEPSERSERATREEDA